MNFNIRARMKFDACYYKRTYKDVAVAWKGSPFSHFMKCGWREGRNPSKEFMSIYYVCRHMSGVISENPLLHYIRNSKNNQSIQVVPNCKAEWISAQREVIKLHFDYDFYEREYGVGKEFAVDDYINRSLGVNPRRPCKNFDPEKYLYVAPYLAEPHVDPFFHFNIMTVSNRKRNNSKEIAIEDVYDVVSSQFDREFYKKTYKDVAQAGVDPVMHFLEHGWKE
jgi:hypothetical protein